LVKAATIVAWINIGLCLLGVAIAIIAIIAAVAADESSSIGVLQSTFA
jgi:hypothetical protein